MAVYCPILNRKVVYLTCQECDDKKCRYEKDDKTIELDSHVLEDSESNIQK